MIKMKNLFAAALLTGALLASANSYAAATENIAIVNIQTIVKDSLAAKDIQDQLEKKRSAYQEEINKREEDLRKEDKELADQRNVLSQEAYEAKVEEFKKKVATVQKDVQQKRVQLDKAYAKSVEQIQEATVKIISDLSKEKGFSVAVPMSQVIFAKDSLDISDEVLVQLNKRLPSVKVEIDASNG